MTKIHNSIEQLKKISSQDSASIKELITKLGKNNQPLTKKDFNDMITSPNSYLIVAREKKNQTIIGMLTLLIFRIPYTKKAFIEDFVVDESFRGEGIGSSLLGKAIELAKENGSKYIDLTSHSGRIASHSLYEKMGFKKRETNVYRLLNDYAEV